MEYSYMGIFSTIFNWILEKILSPVFQFISKLLSSALSWIFNTVLAPVLKEVFWPLLKELVNLIMEILAGIIYGLYAEILTIVDNMSSIFNYMIGLENVTYKKESMPILEAIFKMDGLRTAFLMVSVIGLGIAMITAIYATMQSTLDLDFENKRPVSKVMGSFFRCFLQLLTVEFFVIFLVYFSGLLLKAVDQALNMIHGGGSTTLARMVFTISSMNACKSDKALNLNGKNAALVGIDDPVRRLFYNTNLKDLKTYSYAEINDVEKFFDLSKFDYVIGFVLAIFLIVVMACCLVIFVQRLFDMLMLYLVSPFFIGMMPMDDGEKFGKWRELFIGKCFSGFGMVISMKLYLMLCPTILGSSVVFSASSKELDYMTKMVFVLGGAWAVVKSGPLLTSLLSGESASNENSAVTATTLAAAGIGKGAGGLALAGAGMAIESLRKHENNSKQKFENSKYTGASDSSGNSGQAFTGGSGRENVSFTGSGSLQGSSLSTPTSGNTSSEGAETTNQERENASFTGSGNLQGSLLSTPTSENTSGDAETTNQGQGITANPSPSYTSKAISSSFGIKKYRRADGSIVHGFRPGKGKLFHIGKDEKGNTNFKVLGLGVRWSNGKINKISLPCMRWKRSADGNIHIDKMKFPLGLGTLKRDDNSQSLKFRDFDLIGLKGAHTSSGDYQVKRLGIFGYKAEADQQGNYHMTNLFGDAITRQKDANGEYHITGIKGLMKKEKQEDGNYHLASVLFGLYQQSHMKDTDGKMHIAGVRIFGCNLMVRDDAIERNQNKK